MISAAQLRAARGLLGWSQKDLAEHARVSDQTIRLFETGNREPYPDTMDAITGALESAGVEFVWTDEGQGVVLKHDPLP